MKGKFILVLFIFIAWQNVQAQEKKVYYKDFKLGEYAPISVSYYGNLIIHPGIKAGIDWNLLLIEKTKENKKRIKTVRKILYITPNIAYYSHKSSHKGLIISTDLYWRRYSKKLFYSEFGLGLSYYRIFNSGETWEINDDGIVSNIGNTSRGYFAPSFAFALGKHFVYKKNIPVAVFIKINTNLLLDYNATSVPEFSFELGTAWTLNRGIKRGNVKTLSKHKMK
ncbi:MAG: hypothetical protein L3J74_10975 [Bacteroidales bacterium]|nr:hypothetical protein [Bacteroidales bacterium]